MKGRIGLYGLLTNVLKKIKVNAKQVEAKSDGVNKPTILQYNSRLTKNMFIVSTRYTHVSTEVDRRIGYMCSRERMANQQRKSSKETSDKGIPHVSCFTIKFLGKKVQGLTSGMIEIHK